MNLKITIKILVYTIFNVYYSKDRNEFLCNYWLLDSMRLNY